MDLEPLARSSRPRRGGALTRDLSGKHLLAAEQARSLCEAHCSRPRTHICRKRGARGTFATLVTLAMLTAFAAPADAAGAYVFTKVVDSVADGFNPQTLRISCPSINTRGDIAFKSDRGAAEDGIYRANAGGGVTTIAEVAPGSGFALLANGNPSMNDSGQVSFGASPSPDGGQAIMRGDGTTLTTIARTSTQRSGSLPSATTPRSTTPVRLRSTVNSAPAQGVSSQELAVLLRPPTT